jgi:hypothetical protein
MTNIRRRKAKARRHAGASFNCPGVREYLARPDHVPFDFTDLESDEPIVVEAWWLPNDALSQLWKAPINEYGFVRSPSLDAMYAKVRVDPDETCTLLDPDEPEEAE